MFELKSIQKFLIIVIIMLLLLDHIILDLLRFGIKNSQLVNNLYQKHKEYHFPSLLK